MFRLSTPDSFIASLSSPTVFPVPNLAECCGHWPTHYYLPRGRLLTSKSLVPWSAHPSTPLLASAEGLTAKWSLRGFGPRSIQFECAGSPTAAKTATDYSNLRLVGWCHRWQLWLLFTPLNLFAAEFHVLSEWWLRLYTQHVHGK